MTINKRDEAASTLWRVSALGWALITSTIVLAVLAFRGGFDHFFYMWFNKEEYSHAVIIPFISAFLIWQKKDILERVEFRGSWAGVFVLLVGIAMLFLGRRSALVILEHYGFFIALLGAVLAYVGWAGFRVIFVPLLMLFFTVPLPGFLYEGLSNHLQLLSSKIGVWFIRLFGISVYLEGNVIDLGVYKLQVVEACSGLRYLFPLVSLGFIAAYFFKGALWKRIVIFLSSIPITILMNSFRVGMIGVMVEYWGLEMAEGFLHDFEGWAVFMGCMAVLVLEMWMLAHIGKERGRLREVFGLDFPEDPPQGASFVPRAIPRSSIASITVLGLVTVLSFTMSAPVEKVPDRRDFSMFPYSLGDWKGRNNPLEQIYIDALRFDDYIQADYVDEKGRAVSLFASYYSSQIHGDMPHSPRACLPGGGWNIVDLSKRKLGGVLPGGGSISVNRVVIQNGEYKQLVYYWFQQRGRYIFSEFAVKWYIFWDSLFRNRSDGALVRLVTMIPPGRSLSEADERLVDFTRALLPALTEYIPE